jgi:hypothetical protein
VHCLIRKHPDTHCRGSKTQADSDSHPLRREVFMDSGIASLLLRQGKVEPILQVLHRDALRVRRLGGVDVACLVPSKPVLQWISA